MTITRRTPLSDLPELLTVDEAATWLGMGRALIYRMVERGELRGVRFGRLLRIPRAGLRAVAGVPEESA